MGGVCGDSCGGCFRILRPEKPGDFARVLLGFQCHQRLLRFHDHLETAVVRPSVKGDADQSARDGCSDAARVRIFSKTILADAADSAMHAVAAWYPKATTLNAVPVKETPCPSP